MASSPGFDSGLRQCLQSASSMAALNSCPSSAERPAYETPRDAADGMLLPPALASPVSPANNRKTKSRAGRGLARDNSLKISKVLLITDLKRSDSLADTDLFQYHNHFEFLGVIGATQLSEVFRVRHRLTDEVFAVKRSRRRFRTKLQRERCLREIRAVAELPPHVNIVSQYRAWQEGGHFYIQMDYCDGGSLGDAARGATRAGLPLGDEQLRAVARDVSSGLAFLHAHGVLHLDIKPENLYSALGAGGAAATWRIGDFGLAVAKDMHDWEEGDGQYVAPELLLAGCEPTPAADVFSLGATLFEAATGRKLPRREGSAEAGEVELPGRPQELVDLLRAMLRPDPAARPSAAQVLAALGPPAGAGAGAAQHTPPGARPPGVEFTFDAVPLPEAAQGGATPEQEGGAGAAPAPAPAPANLLLRNPHVPKWAPSLSPLVSEGALTPGAAAGLVGLTPPTAGAGGVGAAAGALLPPPAQRGAALRPPPLQLKPHQQQQPPLASARGPDSFRLRRRDMASPGREPMGSASESEAYSFSCDTGSASDLDFADMLSPGSVDRRNAAAAAGAGPQVAGARGPARLGGGPFLISGDVHSSPDFLAQRAASPAVGPARVVAAGAAPGSLQTSPSGELSSRSLGSVRRFPTLDSMGSMQMDTALTGAADSKSRESLAALAQQAFAVPPLRSPSPTPAPAPREAPGGGLLIPPLLLPSAAPGTLRRKRQHSSRRALARAVHEGDLASARSVDLCSSRSIEMLMPHKKEARRVYLNPEDADDDGADGGGTPDRSGPPTQRSSRGPPTARMAALLEQHAATVTALEAGAGGSGGMSAAAAAAARMTSMTLNDARGRD